MTLQKKTACLLTAVFLTTLLCSCNPGSEKAAGTDASNDIRVKNWIQDIGYMQIVLRTKHKNLYHSIKKEDFDEEVLDLKNDVPKLNDYEIKGRLAQIVASIGDAHTSMNLNFNFDSSYPVRVRWFGKDLRVFKTDNEHKNILGKKLASINSIPITEIVKKTDSLISHENDQWLKATDVQYMVMPGVLKMAGIITEDNAEFAFTDEDNSIITFKLNPKALTAANKVSVLDEASVTPLRLQYDHDSFTDNLYWYKYIPEDKILYFQYNSCIDRETVRQRGVKDYDRYPDFEIFSQGLLKAISDNDISKFVIDLRYNGGGNSSLFTGLARKLAAIDKLKGKVYAMIGRETFSSGVFAAVDLLNSTNAVFYGEPTGGNVNGYGDTISFELPNSKLLITYSTKCFYLSDKFKVNFIPDVEVNETFDNYKNGTDEVYEAVKKSRN